jgi:transposase
LNRPEPTRNAWVRLAAWFRRRGADVVLVPPERSADLRRYYAKHTKSDRLDSQLLARLPMLHPDGLYAEQGLGPGDALKRAAKLHSTLTHRRSQSLARLDALLEILGPAWHTALQADPIGILTSAPGDHRSRDPGPARRPKPIQLPSRRTGLHRPRPKSSTLPA